MMRFEALEQAGLTVAAMSGREEGDCGSSDSAVCNVSVFLGRLGLDSEHLARARQVHGTRIVDAREALEAGRVGRPEGDGIITNEPGLLMGVSVADCAPVLLFDPGIGAACLLHAGREGTFQDIARAGVGELRMRYGSSPASVIALVGPCAGSCCYEVSEEMAIAWRIAGLPARGRCLDIPGANVHQLENAGVIRHNIHVVPHCTVCGGLFFSYRTDKTPNRNLVLMML